MHFRDVNQALKESEGRVVSLRERNKQLAVAAEQERGAGAGGDRGSGSTVGGGRREPGSGAGSSRGGRGGPTNILFLPYSLHPHSKSTR